ncbi:MAG: DNA repair protein RecO [Firmicutes bacterium]|nr:DNA repair protein RecO [Bacillota bacterium]
MAVSRIQAFVLQARPFGESHRLAVLFAREEGVRRVIAHGAAKPQHPLFAATQVMTEGSFLFRRSGQGLGSVEQGETVRAFAALHENPDLLGYGLAAAELLIRVVGDDEQMALRIRMLYQPFALFLQRLSEGSAPGIAVAALILKVAPYSGIALPLICARCHEALQESRDVSILSGGLLCAKCALLPDEQHAWHLSEGASRVLCALIATPFEQIGRVSVRPDTEREVVDVLHALMAEQSGISLRALAVAIATDPRFMRP